MPHVCMDEINAFLLGLPFVSLGLLWVRSHFGRIWPFGRNKKCCDHLPEGHEETV